MLRGDLEMLAARCAPKQRQEWCLGVVSSWALALVQKHPRAWKAFVKAHGWAEEDWSYLQKAGEGGEDME
eukprot:4975245-Lingulodinium_polyedra.AAC.1